jgi:hypothetical protein
MSSSKVDAIIKKITDDLKKLKLIQKEAAKVSSKGSKSAKGSKESKSKKADRPKSIGACKTKTQLMLFTVAELKEWLVAKKIEKITGLKKEDLIKLVLKKLKGKSKKESESESETSDSESDSESESETSDCESD